MPNKVRVEKKQKEISKSSKSKNWIQKAINPKNKGKLREELGAKPGEPIPAKKLAKASKKGGSIGKRARLAKTLRRINK